MCKVIHYLTFKFISTKKSSLVTRNKPDLPLHALNLHFYKASANTNERWLHKIKP